MRNVLYIAFLYLFFCSPVSANNYCSKFRDGDAERLQKAAKYAFAVYRDNLDGNFVISDEIAAAETKSGMRAAAFEDENKEIWISFRGTHNVSLKQIYKDWVLTNGSNVLGGFDIFYREKVAKQTKDAISFGKRIRAKYPNRKINIVGHSQGGHQAIVVQSHIDGEATTFNANHPNKDHPMGSYYGNGIVSNISYTIDNELIDFTYKLVGDKNYLRPIGSVSPLFFLYHNIASGDGFTTDPIIDPQIKMGRDIISDYEGTFPEGKEGAIGRLAYMHGEEAIKKTLANDIAKCFRDGVLKVESCQEWQSLFIVDPVLRKNHCSQK